MEIMEQRLTQIEKKVDKFDKSLDKHLLESESIRAMVSAHDKKLMNGDWKNLTESVQEVREKVIRIEAFLASKQSAWKQTALGIGMVSTLLGVLYTIIQIGG